MNYWQKGFLFLLLLVVSCKNSYKNEISLRHHQGFEQVFELKDYYPDSALSLFNSITDTLDLVGFQRKMPRQFFDYQVLYTELYRNTQEVDNGALVLEAARYYDTLLTGRCPWRSQPEISFMYARANCFAGYFECEQGLSVEALEHFISALRIMDGLNGERDLFSKRDKNPEYLHFTALIYNRISWLFYVNDLWDEAIECLEMANEYLQLEGNMQGVFSNYSVLGEIKMTQGDQEAAKAYFSVADSLKTAGGYQLTIQDWDCKLNEASLMYEKGMKPEAYELIYQTLNRYDEAFIVSQLRFHLGRFYFEDHEYDSALLYLGDGFQEFTYQTVASLDMLAKMCDSLGRADDAAYYNSCLNHVFFSQMDQMHSTSKLSSMFDSYLDSRKDYRRKNRIYLAICIVVLLFVSQIMFAYIDYKRREKKHKVDALALERQKLNLERKIEKAQAISSQQEEKIKGLEDELIKVIARRNLDSLSLEDRVKVLAETPIGKRVCMVTGANVKAGVAYPELVLSRNQLSQLVHAVDTVFPKFSSRIVEMYPRLNYSDVVYCCLYILGITEVQAAALTGKTYQAVWMRSSKLHEIFDNKSDLHLVLFDILKNIQNDINL